MGEEPDGLQFIGSQRVGHDVVIKQPQHERTRRSAGIVYFSNFNGSDFYFKNTFSVNQWRWEEKNEICIYL